MYPHFNQYFKMTPEQALEDDKRVRRNQMEALLLASILGNFILPLRAQASAVDDTNPNNPNAQIEHVCEGADSEKIFEITLCTNSDNSDSDHDSAKSSFFAEGFTPNPPYRRPGQSTTGLFSQKQNSEPLNVVWKVNENSKLSKEATKARKDQEVDRAVTSLIKQHSMGNSNPGIGTKHLEGDIFYLRSDSGARVFFRMRGSDIEILGIANKKK